MSRTASMRYVRFAATLLTVAAFQAAAAPDAAAAQTHTVTMEGMAFVPATLSVQRGDTVVWVNKDPFPHTATGQQRSFDSGEIAAGKTWKFVAGKQGTFAYVCALHPTMKGTLVVK